MLIRMHFMYEIFVSGKQWLVGKMLKTIKVIVFFTLFSWICNVRYECMWLYFHVPLSSRPLCAPTKRSKHRIRWSAYSISIVPSAFYTFSSIPPMSLLKNLHHSYGRYKTCTASIYYFATMSEMVTFMHNLFGQNIEMWQMKDALTSRKGTYQMVVLARNSIDQNSIQIYSKLILCRRDIKTSKEFVN